ncbi:hypothetical protein [Spiroplasma poulsonii]|uniref:hypothetical protein n=1 Tax=Spiroplasma poulsonii TaxID=2138 RepID=UPI001D144C92|nr:hypothetical protein [Spiroplasma poulsonii]
MFGENFLNQPLAVFNLFQFAPNNKISLALDLTIPLFSFDNGDNNQAYAFYIRPNIGNIKPWFTENGQTTIAYQVDRKQPSNIANILQKHFFQFNYSFSMLEIYWNFNNKKNCKITIQLQAGYSQAVLQFLELKLNIQIEEKLLCQDNVLMKIKLIKLVLLLVFPI